MSDPTRARRMRALAAAALQSLEDSTTYIAEVLSEPPGSLKTTDVYVVLLHCPGIGREKAREIFERARVWPHTPLGRLTNLERTHLFEAIPTHLRGEPDGHHRR